MFPINILAIIISAIAAFVIGFLMHGPIAGKLWMKLANIHPTGKEKLSDMYGKMFWNFVVNLVMALVLAIIYAIFSASPLLNYSPIWTGIFSAIIVWIGFMVTTTSIDVIWMGKSPKLWLFECFSSLVSIVAMGAIIGAW